MSKAINETLRENENHCKHIADELNAIAEGRIYKCPECENTFSLDDIEDYDVDDECAEYELPCRCGSTHDIEDLEQVSMYDYITDVYDIEYRIGGNREYRSCALMVAGGGPNIYVDTGSKMVELYWWGDRASWGLYKETVEQIDECMEELYRSM